MLNAELGSIKTLYKNKHWTGSTNNAFFLISAMKPTINKKKYESLA
jgi:hypothetical protein